LDTIEESERILGNLVRAVEMLQQCPEFSSLVPEVRVNVAYALPGAKSPGEVAAIDGRITVVRGLPSASGLPRWGASQHMARLLIEVRAYDPEINAGINFKCDSALIEIIKEYCRKKSMLFGWIDRAREPADIARQEGASMPWKIRELVTSSRGMPRLFYEGEGWGKEPLFVAIGRNAVEVAGIAIEIARCYHGEASRSV